MIEVKHVFFSYGAAAVLSDVSLELRPGEIVALQGPSGSGKSTLATVLDGLIIPQHGDCIVDGVSTRSDPFFARRRVGLVFQDPDDQIVSRLVDDDVAFGPLNLEAADVDARVSCALEEAGIGHLAGRDTRTLSGGQKQLVAIAGVLAMRPAYVVFDEPTALLDQDGTDAVVKALGVLRKAGKGILLITHDPAVASMADRALVLQEGKISPARAADDVELPELARLWKRLKEQGVYCEGPEPGIEGTLEALCRLRPKA